MIAAALPILTYHALDRSRAVTSTDPSWFRETIERLVSAGHVGVELTGWIARGRPEVANGFAVAFDDGLRSILDGSEVLAHHHIPATVFLVSDHVGSFNDWHGQPREIAHAPMLDWSECRELSRRGFRFAAHTATHPSLDRLGPAAIDDELRRSRDAIEARLDRDCGLFAYPYGVSTPSIRDRAASLFDGAFGTRMALAAGASPLHDLPRIDAYYLKSPAILDMLISRDMNQWLLIRRGLRNVRRLASSLIPVFS